MAIFIWMYILLILIGQFSTRLPIHRSRYFQWLLGFIVLWGIQALRSTSVGNDLEVYLPAFQKIDTTSLTFEPGYMLLNISINHLITKDENMFLAIVSFVTLFPISLLYRKYSYNIILSYIVFASFILYHFTFSGLRQGIALGIIAFSYQFIERKQLIKFVTVVIAGACFHVSAVIFLIAYPLCNIVKMTKIKYVLTSISAIFALFSLRPILSIVLPLIFGEGKYLGYVEHETTPAYNLLIVLLLFFLSTFLIKSTSRNFDNYRALLFCAVICQCLGFISQTATRIGYYFLLFLPLIIPDWLNSFRAVYSTKLMLRIGIVSFMIFFFFYSNGSGYLKVIPYSFLWE